MGKWGKGWQVGINKEIDAQRRAAVQAAIILRNECGTHHATGSRDDLCPKCIEYRARIAADIDREIQRAKFASEEDRQDFYTRR